MQVAELIQPRQFRLTQAAPLSDPGPGQIQVAVKAIGICGSDMHLFAEGGIGETRCAYPVVLGHEPSGVVLKTGAGVSGWSSGDRAVLEPALYCYHCEFCMSGRHNVCQRIRFMSLAEEPGFFREFVNLPVTNLLPLPKSMSFSEGALIEPLGVIVHSMKFAAPKPGQAAAVFGAGPIGLLTIALLKLSGVTRIWAVEPVAARRELALAVGASAAIDPAAVDPIKEILHDTAQRGVDMAIDCAAKDDTTNACIRVACNGGHVVVTGVPSENSIRMDFHILRRKELGFFSVRRSNHDAGTSIQLLVSHPGIFAPILTHQRPLGDVQQAFELVERREDGVGKLTLTL